MHSEVNAERAPEAVERFIKQLLVAYKAVKLYPPASDIPRESAGDLLVMLRGLLKERSDLRFQVTKEGLLFGSAPVLFGQRPFETFAHEFYNRGLNDVRFHTSVTPKQVIDFLRLLQEQPEAIQASGGFEQRLWDLQVDGISVTVITARVVDSDLAPDGSGPSDQEEWPPPFERVDELVESAYGAHPRDHRMLVRFVQNPRLVSRYLEDVSSTGQSGRALAKLLANRIASLAHVAYGELAEEQPALFRSIAESLLSLDPEVRRDVLVERLLPDARLDEAIAGVLRQFELGELCSALAEGVSPDPVSRDGLSRAIKNLAVISMRPKEEVLGAAETALREAGGDETTVATILENAAPSQLSVAPEPVAGNESVDSVESVIRLVDLAPVAAEAADEGVLGVRDEVAAGVSDGDIMLSVVTLIAVERRPEMFASLMAIVEDGLGLLLEWGEYDDAADAAGAFAALMEDESLDESQRARVRSALTSMSEPQHMRELAAALRRHGAGTPEYEACLRLMTTLGENTIAPLLEVLADEPDMTARKVLVDVISSMAPSHIDSLGGKITDSRWYFVRNVVALLGATRRPEAVQYLARTLRHPDTRVRRETIRAVAGIKDSLAEEMLVASLGDADAQNVGLAARLLGTQGSRNAFAPLASVARGEGRGNRELGARIEAIEALGRLGVPEAEAVLDSIVHQRGTIWGGRTRELRTAAEAALAEIRRDKSAGGAR